MAKLLIHQSSIMWFLTHLIFDSMTVKTSNPKTSVTGHEPIRTRRNVNTYTPDVMIQKNLNDTVALRFDFYFRMKFLSLFSIITQVIIETLALSLVENGVIFRYKHLSWLIFKMAASRFIDVPEEELNVMKEKAIPRNTNIQQSSKRHL